jgi:hypothetical protein
MRTKAGLDMVKKRKFLLLPEIELRSQALLTPYSMFNVDSFPESNTAGPKSCTLTSI